MKIYYWCPFFTNVATEKAVLNSVISIKKYSKEIIKPILIDTIGEWSSNLLVKKKNITVYNFNTFKIIKYLPKFGFIKSRFSYLVVFLISIIKLHLTLKKDKPKFIIIHLMTFIPLILLFFFKYETKFILRISGLPKLNFLRKNLWKLVGNKIFKITTPTKLTLQFLKDNKIFDEKKVSYLPDPIINISEIKKLLIKKKKSKNNKIRLIAIGRLTTQKNFDLLIDAFEVIIKKYPKCKLYILGSGEKKSSLKKKIVNRLLSKHIFLLGHKNNVYKYLASADIFILSSLWEDPGFVLVEAGYMEKIILSSDCPNGPKELLENGKNGFLFKSGSIEDLIIKFQEIQNMDKDEIYKKKVYFKKKIKEFTLLNHFRVLQKIIYE